MALHRYAMSRPDDAEIPQPTVYCSAHPGNPVDVYCDTCKEPVCMKCTVVEHRVPDHQHRDLEKAAVVERRRLHGLVQKARAMRKECTAGKNRVNKELDNLRATYDKIQAAIEEHTQAIINKIKEKQEKIKKELYAMVKKKSQILQAQNKELTVREAALASVDDFSGIITNYASASQYLTSHGMLEQRLNDLIENEINTTPKENSYIGFRQEQDVRVKSIGKLETTAAVGGSSSVAGLKKLVKVDDEFDIKVVTRDCNGKPINAGNFARVVLKSPQNEVSAVDLATKKDGRCVGRLEFKEDGEYEVSVRVCRQDTVGSPFAIVAAPPTGTIRTFGEEGSKPGQFRSPWKVCINNEGRLVAADYHNCRLQVLDWNISCRDVIDCKAFCKSEFKPVDVAVTADGKYVVTNLEEVVIADENGRALCRFGRREGVDPRGVAITNDGNVLVTDWNSHCVRKYSVVGKHLASYGSEGTGRRQFQRPVSPVVNSRNQILVSDMGNRRVQILSPEGKFLGMFASIGSGHGEVEVPRGIDVDSDDNVYVCDTNGRVVKFASDGKFLCEIGLGRFSKPTYVAVAKDGTDRIAVTELGKHHVKVMYL
ncbi:tripartite motif-containing protein 2-like [Ptychodera flava]|uniref:tripartite motif-containing protein 2-like n=1 Tax=Ptychodera flava TaxID=63121 RepID=UPI003969F996